MVKILARIFIKDYKNYSEHGVRKQYGFLTGLIGIVLNLLLFAGKFFAGIITGAISVMADAFNNLSDAASSVISLIGFWMGDKKPDIDHPFGHGRMEYISGLLVSILIILMGFELGKSSFDKILHPEQVTQGNIAIVILAVSILVKLYMFFYNNAYGKKLNAPAMKATALDSVSDCISTAAVLITIIITKYTGVNIDGAAGLVVSCFILLAGVKSVKETINPLLGTPPEKEFVDRIYEIVMSYDEILGIHDLVVHDYGPGRVMISLHGEVSEDGTLNAVHEVIDACEHELNEKLGCEAIIHMDPISVNNEKVNGIRQKVMEKLKEYDDKITIHDFRIVDAGPVINVIFDAVVPYDHKETDKEIKQYIERLVSDIPGGYNGIVDIDREYTGSCK